MQILFFVLMFVLGCVFGSFLCCQARRMHLKGAKKPVKNSRSVCLHCHKKLKWYDNVPIISWLMLRGKCRFCHQKIGGAEILAEILSGVALLLIATTINVETASVLAFVKFVLVAIFTLLLLYLAIYDGLYGELPSVVLTILVICAIITLIPQMWTGFLVEPLLAGLLFGGIYLTLYIISKGKWVGDGDWVLALAIGLVLGNAWLAILALFVANFSACLIMIPFLKKLKNHQIYFGPFLALSFVVVYATANFWLSIITVATGTL